MSESATPAVAAGTLLEDVMATHATRGQHLQRWLRLALVVFVWGALLAEPPSQHAAWCFATAAAYPVLWASLVFWLSRLTPLRRSRLLWLPLALDIVVLGVITVLANASAEVSWTAYVIVSGFYLLPVLAATQLRPGVALVMAAPTLGVYLFSSISTREDNDEPWSSLLLRTAILVMLCAGSVALSRIQRSRVLEIGGLATEQSRLLVELTAIEDRERRRLSEALHDGALQYVLAARMDLEDVRDGDQVALDRVDHALSTSATLLRTKVGELHPAVLERAGLVRAVQDLAEGVRGRGLAVEVRSAGLPDGSAGSAGSDGPAGPVGSAHSATDADRVVFAAVRELLANVVKHAKATSVVVELRRTDGQLSATVTDDGTGMAPGAVGQRLADGHIGLTSHRLRVEASGGRLVTSPVQPHGTRVEVVIPV